MSSLQAEILDGGTMTLDALKLRLAAQVAPKTWRRALLGGAERLESGASLEEVVRQTKLPAELASLMRAALPLPDPTGFLLNSLRARDEVRATWSAFLVLVSYPLALLLFASLIGASFSYSVRGMVDFSEMESYGLPGMENVRAMIDDQHAAMRGAALAVGWMVLVLLSVFFFGPAWGWNAILGGVLIIGRPLRWVSLEEILHRFHLFAEQGVSGARLGQAVADSFSKSAQATVARGIAQRMDAGVPLGRSLAMSMYSDPLCRPALLLLDKQGSQLTDALMQTARLLGSLSEQRCRVMSMIVPVFLLAAVGTILWSTITCYMMIFMPLVKMISSLS